MIKMVKYLKDWKVHAFCLAFVIVAELIGNIVVGPFPLFGANIGFTIFPMLFAMMFGVIFYLLKLIDKETVETATPYIGIATMWLIAKLALGIGPNLGALAEAGPAFVLQEFGNLGTALFAMPIAIFVFSMGKQSIGASFSKSREGSIALISSMHGLDSPQGQGIMGAYIVGTVLGTLFCGILASIVVSTGIFEPVALAMAAGSGSASMMAAFLAPMQEAYPHLWDELQAVASMSNLITAATGIYFSMFVVIPVCNWMYKTFKGEERYIRKMKKKAEKAGIEFVPPVFDRSEASADDHEQTVEKKCLKKEWFVRLKVLGFSGVFGVIANWISTDVSIGEGLIALFWFSIPVLLGCVVYDVVTAKTKIKLPVIIFISLIGIILSIPGVPLSAYFIAANDQIGLLPLTVPILAYAGISLGKDLKTFKEQGLAIICVTLLAFAGTYLGSAIIAHLYLTLVG
jgi:hypothetical protein